MIGAEMHIYSQRRPNYIQAFQVVMAWEVFCFLVKFSM